MTASAPLVGTLRTIPDAASAPPPDSGVPAHANFRSVLEQYHVTRESDSNSDDPQSAREQKHKDSDTTAGAANAVVPQQVTPPAVEAPRVTLPFTASFDLRQDASASDEGATIQDSTAAADSNTVPSEIQTASSRPAILQSTLDVRSFLPESDTKTNNAHGMAQPKAHTKEKDSAPSQTIAAQLAPSTTADPSAPVNPVASSTTLEQAAAATALQNSSTVNDAPATVSTSTLDRGASILATSRNAAYQYHLSHESDSAMVSTRPTVTEQPKVSDPAATITAPVPVPETVDPQRLLHPPAGPNTPRQDAPAVQSSSAVTQDSSAAPGTDSKTVMPPVLERADDTPAAPPTGSLAFAARLTLTEETPAPDAGRPADPQSRAQTAWQSATTATIRQIVSETDVPADTHGGDSGSQSDKEQMSDRFAKPAMVLPQMHATSQDQTAAAPTGHAPTSTLSASARMDQVQEPPASAPGGNHDITIRLPDATNDQGTAVRFVERAGEVHVSVRTGDADMAQTLRGGLHDLVNRLEDGGIRTQVWQPGTDSSASQNDSHQPFADPDGSNGRQYSSGSNSEQESQQHNKPRWVEELEGSIGNPNFKETTQLPWQA